EAFLGWALRNGRSFADPAMIAELGAELPRVMRANPLIEVPADVLLVGRVMGLLSGIGKQLGAHVDLGATLLPYLAAGAARPEAWAGAAQRVRAGTPPPRPWTRPDARLIVPAGASAEERERRRRPRPHPHAAPRPT